MDPLTVYTKKNCNFCDQIKQVLNLKNVPYEEKVLDNNVGGCIQTIKYLKSNNII